MTKEAVMTPKGRKKYLVCTLTLFVCGLIFYGLYVGLQAPLLENGVRNFLLYGAAAGLILASAANGIFLAIAFFKKRSGTFKTVSLILFPVTAIAFYLVGAITYIPYLIYNIRAVCLSRSENIQKNNP